ncbi:MAG: RimK family alpha-L-glutamate ligase [Candidatus Methanomethylicia archaeon]
MKIGCFVESYNFKYKMEVEALKIFRETARKMGYEFELVGKDIFYRINDFNSIFIRATTDPLFTSYVVSRLAEEYGKKVIDDSESIRICSDKITLHYRLQRNNVPIPETIIFHGEYEMLNLFAEKLGYPVVVKAPNSRFSLYVEKANNFNELLSITRRFLRRSKAVILQKFIPTKFDWRIGILNREILYVCKYYIPRGGWRIRDIIDGKIVWGRVEAINRENIPSKLRKIAIKAIENIGNGLYGVDIKEFNGEYYVIEINDNPTIMHGMEDAKNTDIYEKIIHTLTS